MPGHDYFSLGLVLPVFSGLMDIFCTLMFQPLIEGQENVRLTCILKFHKSLSKFALILKMQQNEHDTQEVFKNTSDLKCLKCLADMQYPEREGET